MDSSQLGQSELGNFQLGGLASGGGPATIEITYTSTGNVTQSGVDNYQKHFTITNTASVTQTTVYGNYFELTVTSRANVNQTPFVNSPRLITISSQALVFQTVTPRNATFVVIVTSTGNASQVARGHNSTFIVSVTNTANVHQNPIIRDQIFTVSMTHTGAVKQKINKAYPIQMTTTGSLTQTFEHLRTTSVTFADTQTLSSSYTPQRYATHNLNDSLTLEDSYTRSGEYERTFNDYQVLTDVFRSAILISGNGLGYDPYPVGPGQTPTPILPHPVVTGTPVIQATQTVIESPVGIIYLPAAEYGDTFAPKIQSTIKKSMTGKLYTYIRTNLNDKFSLTWVLGLQKALELAAYVDNNIENNLSGSYTLNLWNGEIWTAKITSADIPVTYEGRWQNSDNNNSEIERLNVVLTFEGKKLL